jgi:tRNA-uridine 2-sulfurtransferase
MNANTSKVVVGLSGGVDSSVAAATLHRQGYAVEGLTLWLMRGKGQCCSEGMVDAARLCEEMGVPYHVVDTRELFEKNIVDYLVSGYSTGITPLPCSQCNKAVKFSPMLQYAQSELGIDRIATGHYARITYDAGSDRHQLRRAVDSNKDQSYFLYDLSQEILAHTLFPLGDQTKPETRRMAAEFGLHTADKPESQDLCLIEAHGSMRQFLEKYLTPQTGEIVDQAGRVLGQHDGIHNYTIGQRKGIGIAAAQPLYVIGIDAGRNQVIVGDRTVAQTSEFAAQRVNWVSITAPTAPIRAEVQIRYRSAPVPCTVIPIAPDSDLSRVKVVFDESQFSVTPGQAAVWYDGEVLLGGGIIESEV